MNIESALAQATKSLSPKSPSARLDAMVLMAHALEISREKVMAYPEKELNDTELSLFLGYIERRSQFEPIAYIIGNKEFWSLDFCVNRDTLIPRPDSETLVEAALKKVPILKRKNRAEPITILDIGTGSGCLLIALLKEIPEAQGVGVDTNERALLVAEGNAARLGVKDRSRWIKSHWCDAIDGTFDLVISNPPYIAQSQMATLMDDVACFEPHLALDAGIDGLDAYRALAPQIALMLAPDGYAVLEVGEGQADDVADLLKQQGLQLLPHTHDLSGIARCVMAHNTPT